MIALLILSISKLSQLYKIDLSDDNFILQYCGKELMGLIRLTCDSEYDHPRFHKRYLEGIDVQRSINQWNEDSEQLQEFRNRIYDPEFPIKDIDRRQLSKDCCDKPCTVDNKFYQQEFGMAMGSPPSLVLSNIYIEEFERRVMDSYELKSKMWLRYVDDTFVIWPHGEEKINGFLQHLEEESINFTMELEVDNRIPFLDVLVHKQCDGTLRTTVYKKPMHTGQYLHFESKHPHNVKLGVAECLYNRAREKNTASKRFAHIAPILVYNTIVLREGLLLPAISDSRVRVIKNMVAAKRA
ncbi:hypothetical protein Trydic_g14592 [Trypoxylus dichotomus]